MFEPFLPFTHRPNLLLRALSQGKNFGDAVYYALPALSWQAVAIGDPLYRPFKVTLEEQEQFAGARSPYGILRRANLLWDQKKKTEALALLRSGLSQQPGLVLGLALAQRTLAAGEAQAAVAALDFVAQVQEFRSEEWPLAREAAALLADHDARPRALSVYATLARMNAPTPEAHQALLTEARAVADAAGDLSRSQEFARRLNELLVPAVPPAKSTP